MLMSLCLCFVSTLFFFSHGSKNDYDIILKSVVVSLPSVFVFISAGFVIVAFYHPPKIYSNDRRNLKEKKRIGFGLTQ